MSPTIAFDAMGGDFAPRAAVEGVARLSLETELDLVLVGDEPRISELLAETRHNAERIAVHHAPLPVGTELSGEEASLSLASRLVAEGKADALVTGGDTATCLRVCERTFDLIPGVPQAALAAVFPTELRRGAKADPFSLLLDVGAHPKADADALVAYGVMGAAYAGLISENPIPRVCLLSGGGREPPEVSEAHRRLASRGDLEEVGRVEGLEIPKGAADVVVANGFVGGLVLRMLEGVAETALGVARSAQPERSWRLGLSALAGGLRQLRATTDWRQYGGAPVLGYDAIVLLAHPRSGPHSFANAGKVAAKAAAADLRGLFGERLRGETRLVARA